MSTAPRDQAKTCHLSPSPAKLHKIVKQADAVIEMIRGRWVPPKQPEKPWWDSPKPKPRAIGPVRFSDRMRRWEAEHASIKHDDLVKILETAATRLRELIMGIAVQGWPFQVSSAINSLGRFLTDLANCLHKWETCSIPIRLVQTAQGAVRQLRDAKPLEQAPRKPPAQKTRPGEAGGGDQTPKTPPEPVSPPPGTTPSVQAGANEESPLDETPGYVWINASEAARYIGTTEKTIRSWIVNHTLAIYGEHGISYKFRQSELDAKKAAWRPRKRKNRQSD